MKLPLALIASGLIGGLLLLSGGKGVGPSKPDAVSAVFDTQEAAFRKHIGELAVKLKAGEFASEKAATDWMDSQYGPASEAAWVPLLTAEAAEFGGDKWTAEKHAAYIERYAR